MAIEHGPFWRCISYRKHRYSMAMSAYQRVIKRLTKSPGKSILQATFHSNPFFGDFLENKPWKIVFFFVPLACHDERWLCNGCNCCTASTSGFNPFFGVVGLVGHFKGHLSNSVSVSSAKHWQVYTKKRLKFSTVEQGFSTHGQII